WGARRRRFDLCATKAAPAGGGERTPPGPGQQNHRAGPGAGELDGAKHNHSGEAEADRRKSLRDRAESLIGDDGDRQGETRSGGENKPAFHVANLSLHRAKFFRANARVWPNSMRLSPRFEP